eukprot:355683-Chlamydomonas_euryale.AAC.2
MPDSGTGVAAPCASQQSCSGCSAAPFAAFACAPMRSPVPLAPSACETVHSPTPPSLAPASSTQNASTFASIGLPPLTRARHDSMMRESRCDSWPAPMCRRHTLTYAYCQAGGGTMPIRTNPHTTLERPWGLSSGRRTSST